MVIEAERSQSVPTSVRETRIEIMVTGRSCSIRGTSMLSLYDRLRVLNEEYPKQRFLSPQVQDPEYTESRRKIMAALEPLLVRQKLGRQRIRRHRSYLKDLARPG